MLRKMTFFALVCGVLLCTAAYGVTMDWITVGNVGNNADDTGYGSVDYEYKISQYEVTYSQYVEFLNAVAKTDTNNLYNNKLSTQGGISRSGSVGSYTYSLKNSNWTNRPINYVTWYDALRFTNWMHNGQPVGLQSSSTTENGAYDMSLGTSVVRNTDALFALPEKNEFYKAAYYDAHNDVYYNYAMGSDATPNNNLPNSDTGNSANFWSDSRGFIIGDPYYTTVVGAYDESESPYGTYDQNGNLWEWSEDTDGNMAYLYGGAWSSSVTLLSAEYYGDLLDPSITWASHGFRLVTDFLHDDPIPEPATMILLGTGLLSVLLRRKK